METFQDFMSKQIESAAYHEAGHITAAVVQAMPIRASGIINVVRGRLHYLTYWHAPMFFPFLIFIGILVLAVAFTRRK